MYPERDTCAKPTPNNFAHLSTRRTGEVGQTGPASQQTTCASTVGRNSSDMQPFFPQRRLCTKTQMWEASLTPITHGITTCCAVGTVIAVRDRSHIQFWCKAEFFKCRVYGKALRMLNGAPVCSDHTAGPPFGRCPVRHCLPAVAERIFDQQWQPCASHPHRSAELTAEATALSRRERGRYSDSSTFNESEAKTGQCAACSLDSRGQSVQ